MNEELLERARAGLDAWRLGDLSALEDLLDPNVDLLCRCAARHVLRLDLDLALFAAIHANSSGEQLAIVDEERRSFRADDVDLRPPPRRSLVLLNQTVFDEAAQPVIESLP